MKITDDSDSSHQTSIAVSFGIRGCRIIGAKEASDGMACGGQFSALIGHIMRCDQVAGRHFHNR